MSVVLHASNICKSYHTGRVTVEALKPTSLNIVSGSINIIIGRSGSGKSTLLKVLGGLIKPDNGEVVIEGQSFYSISEAKSSRLRSTKIGFVFQEFNLIHELSVINNIRLPFDINQLAYDQHMERELIGMLGLEERLHFYPDQLSGGERQRTAIARALIMKPSVILMDEPTGNLDSESGKSVIDFVESSNRLQKQTYVIVTHNAEWLKIAHQVCQMSDGSLSIQE